jgi:hypothetical protein
MARPPKTNRSAGNGRKLGQSATAPLDWFRDGPSFEALSDDQKRQVSEYLDRPDAAREFRPLSAAQRRRWERVRLKPGRPKVGKGTKVVSVTVERGLLGRADAYAKAAGLTRARLVSLALESLLKKAGP